MRATLVLSLWALLVTQGVRAVVAQDGPATARDTTFRALEGLLATYEPARAMQFAASAREPFAVVGTCARDLRYASRFDVTVSVTSQRTIAFRIYPRWRGFYLSLNDVRDRRAFMQKLLRDADQNFFHWAVDSVSNVFAGFTFTLESGFPEEAIRVVIVSIPLLDRSVGELLPYLE